MQKIMLLLLLIFNMVGLMVVAIDKYKAIHHRWRVPERVFFTMAILGACPGVYGGCLLFRHKTQHKSFMLGLPTILLLQAAATVWLCAGKRF